MAASNFRSANLESYSEDIQVQGSNSLLFFNPVLIVLFRVIRVMHHRLLILHLCKRTGFLPWVPFSGCVTITLSTNASLMKWNMVLDGHSLLTQYGRPSSLMTVFLDLKRFLPSLKVYHVFIHEQHYTQVQRFSPFKSAVQLHRVMHYKGYSLNLWKTPVPTLGPTLGVCYLCRTLLHYMAALRDPYLLWHVSWLEKRVGILVLKHFLPQL